MRRGVPRVCRRLQPLRSWSHDEQDDDEVLKWAGEERGTLALKWAELNERG